MRKPFKIAIGVALGLLILIQLVPVDRDNPSTATAMALPDGEVGTVLRAACYDCHSHETVWPWYSAVAPVSFWLAEHVEEGREHLNFSTWGATDAGTRDHKLDELIEMVEEGEMPLRSYTFGHPEARLTDAQRQLLIEWARQERGRIQAEPGFTARGERGEGGERGERGEEAEERGEGR